MYINGSYMRNIELIQFTSFAGFQSGSRIMVRLAPVKFKPRLAVPDDNKKMLERRTTKCRFGIYFN